MRTTLPYRTPRLTRSSTRRRRTIDRRPPDTSASRIITSRSRTSCTRRWPRRSGRLDSTAGTPARLTLAGVLDMLLTELYAVRREFEALLRDLPAEYRREHLRAIALLSRAHDEAWRDVHEAQVSLDDGVARVSAHSAGATVRGHRTRGADALLPAHRSSARRLTDGARSVPPWGTPAARPHALRDQLLRQQRHETGRVIVERAIDR
jgi:hypothetical protein